MVLRSSAWIYYRQKSCDYCRGAALNCSSAMIVSFYGTLAMMNWPTLDAAGKASDITGFSAPLPQDAEEYNKRYWIAITGDMSLEGKRDAEKLERVRAAKHSNVRWRSGNDCGKVKFRDEMLTVAAAVLIGTASGRVRVFWWGWQ